MFDPARVTADRIGALRQAWAIAPDERVVLLPARLTRWKGQIEFIRAAALVRASLPGRFAFIIAGDDQGRHEYTAEIDAAIRDQGLDGFVRRVGHCNDIPAACMLADVVAVPSIEPEAFGRTAVEAQAMGAPVVVSNIGALAETVLAPPDVPEFARTGWRVDPGNIEALTGGILAALQLSPPSAPPWPPASGRRSRMRFPPRALSPVPSISTKT